MHFWMPFCFLPCSSRCSNSMFIIIGVFGRACLRHSSFFFYTLLGSVLMLLALLTMIAQRGCQYYFDGG